MALPPGPAAVTGPVLRVGVIGLGVGGGHIRAYRALPQLYRVEAVCDLDQAKACTVACEYGVPHVVPDLAALLALDLDLIDICTPSALHLEHALAALAAGRDVVLEKPIAGSLAAADRLAAAEAASGHRIAVVFQYRWGTGLRRLQHLRALGLAGRPYAATVETHWRRGGDYYAGWRGSWAGSLGGTLVTHAIHANDLITHILGPVKRVFAHMATLVNPEVETEDCAALLLEMHDGTPVTHSITVGAEENMSRLRFCFAGLTAESSRSPYHPSEDPWGFRAFDPARQAEVDAAAAAVARAPGRFAGQFAAMHAALTGGGPLPVTLADGRAALELITAAYHSARSGEAVALPLARDHPLYQGWLPAREGRD